MLREVEGQMDCGEGEGQKFREFFLLILTSKHDCALQ
jgi:hypothetical protein